VTTVHRHAEAKGAPWQAQALARGYQASMALPIVLDGQPIGVLGLYAGEANAFDDDAARLLDELANDVAFGLHTLRVRAARDQAEAQLQALNAELEARVRERTAALQQSAAEFEELYDRAPCGYHSLDATGRYLRVNQYELQLLGYTRDELVGRLSFADVLSPTSAAEFRANFGRFQADGQAHNVELELRRRDGSAIPVLLSADAVHDEAGRFVMSRSMLIDITDRKHAEAEIQALNAALAERAGELEAANGELRAFSYSVSHDLRAPLRSIDGFSLALVEDYGPTLDDRARDYLSRIRASAQRMGELIDALLGLSRVTRAELRRVPLDLSALAAAVVAELRQREPERPVEFTLAPDLSAPGDPSLMRNVLENLLGNAWKFTAGCQPARIEFGCQPSEQTPGGRVFFVRDNGAGFDMTYADRLFGAFQRLHDQREFPGTGVGLASVQRIIIRHGGRVWAEAVAGEGATFYFNLP
jgi:PAS domain S-box-containing protein